MTIHNGITELVGQTPLLRLTRFSQQHQLTADLVAKLEYFNPNHSIKDRTALAMIEAAERSGKLRPGMTLVDTTSGNTGIGLAAIAAAKGYKFRVYLHDKLSAERFAILNAFGAEIIPFSAVPGFDKVIEASDGDFVAAARWLADNVILKEPNICFTCQLENPANPQAHFHNTGPEYAGKRIVAILADSGLTYLSTGLFDPALSVEQLQAAALNRQAEAIA
ncbi:hypothetical protein CQ001_01155 [Erwinia billingiae]|nr:hypothetical protein CQ001_01155 [Erwinia billingiae]